VQPRLLQVLGADVCVFNACTSVAWDSLSSYCQDLNSCHRGPQLGAQHAGQLHYALISALRTTQLRPCQFATFQL
jgi:hypothetical protein